MKKRLPSLVLVLSLALALVVAFGATAFAQEPTVKNVGSASDLEALNDGDTAKLTADIVIMDDVAKTNLKIFLNGYKITSSNSKHLTGETVVFAITSEADMNKAIESRSARTRQVWDIQNDIALKQSIYCEYFPELIINGNSYVISGSSEATANTNNTKFLFKVSVGTTSKTVVFNNLTLKTNDKFQRCLYIEGATANKSSAVLRNVTLDNTESYTDGSSYKGACIVNNYGKVIVKGTCKFITGQFSWTAIDLTGKSEKPKAELIFDNGVQNPADKAVVTFNDGRTDAKKASEPLIGTENSSYVSVINATVANLAQVSQGSNGTSMPGKDGYDVATVKNERTNNLYATLNNALDGCQAGDTLSLIGDTAFTKNTGVPANVSIKLNGYSVTKTEGMSFYSGDNFTFVVSCEKDLNTAAALSQQSLSRKFIWKLSDNFTVSETVRVNLNSPQITIDGNSKTITATNSASGVASQEHVITFANANAGQRDVIIKNLVIKIQDGFRSGLCFHKESGIIDATLDGVNISASRTTAPLKSKDAALESCTGTLIQNNGCTVNIKNAFSLTTDEYCWDAIDIDKSAGYAKVVIDAAAQVTCADNRTAAMKIAEPYIGLDGEGLGTASVTNASSLKLFENAYTSKSGYDIELRIVCDDAEWQIGDAGSITLKAQYDFAKFDSVKVDGSKIDSKNYEAKSGSTVVTFKKAYLDSLAAGDHQVQIKWTDDTTASATITIKAAEVKDNPDDKEADVEEKIAKTGDTAGMAICGVAALALFGGIACMIARRKSQN